MGLLEKLFGDENRKKEIVPLNMSLDVQNDILRVHTDIRDLLWITNGPRKKSLSCFPLSIL